MGMGMGMGMGDGHMVFVIEMEMATEMEMAMAMELTVDLDLAVSLLKSMTRAGHEHCPDSSPCVFLRMMMEPSLCLGWMILEFDVDGT